jgi:hypothetical protein
MAEDPCQIDEIGMVRTVLLGPSCYTIKTAGTGKKWRSQPKGILCDLLLPIDHVSADVQFWRIRGADCRAGDFSWLWPLVCNLKIEAAMISNFCERRNRNRFQQNLVAFLNTEMHLAFEFCYKARIQADLENIELYANSIANAQNALARVRRFEERISDSEASRVVHEKANRIEQLMATL